MLPDATPQGPASLMMLLAAIDDTLFRRRGKKVWAAGWFHDGSAPGPAKTGYGNNWVIAAIVVKLPMVKRPVALPGRRIHVVADAAYAGEELKKLPPGITWTTRLRKDATLYELPPACTGRRGRPRAKGARLPSLDVLARRAPFGPVTVARYGKTATIHAAAVTCLWYGSSAPGASRCC